MLVRKRFFHKRDAALRVNLAVGAFDSLHKGHIRVIDELLESCRRERVKSCLVTFENRPKHVLFGRNDGMILENSERMNYFRTRGIDLLFLLRFTRAFARLSPSGFLDRITRSVRVNRIIIGEDFRFGRENRGDTVTLRRFGKKYGYSVKIIRNLRENREKISTTLIKRHITRGEVDRVRALLGRPFHINGRIVRGKGLGSRIKFPTINLELINKSIILPGNGVYLTRVLLAGRLHDGMTFVGMDFMSGKSVIETHIFRFRRAVYGKEVSLFFLEKFRDERRFKSVGELERQLVRDRRKALRLVKTYGKRRLFS